MKKVILLAMSLMVGTLNAQSLEWAKQITGASNIGGKDMVLDGSGNIYTMGTFRYTADFDPSSNTYNLTSNGEADIFITKFDSQGMFLWAKQIGAQAYDDEPANIAVDANGYLVIAGSFRGTVDLDPGAGVMNVSTQGKEAFLVKLDTNGDLVWAKHWGGNTSGDENHIYSMALDNSNNILIGGGFKGSSDLDPNSGTFNATALFLEDAYISKLDTNGALLWAKNFGGDAVGSRDYVNSIAVDASGNIVASGPFYGSIANYNLMNGHNFYIKLDVSGNLIWSKQTSSSSNSIYTNSLKIDASGNAYILGRFVGTCDFDPGNGVFNITSSAGLFDIFILKLTADGDFDWASRIGGDTALDEGHSIEVDNQGYVYATGYYRGAADFDPSIEEYILNPVGFLDMFLLKLDTSGNFVYANTFGSTTDGTTIGKSIFSDDTGNVYITGSFQNTTDFDPSSSVFNLVSQGFDDVFVLKLDGAILGITDTELVAIALYPNPSTGNFSINFGKTYEYVTVEISNMLGQVISSEKYASAKIIEQKITASAGIYFVRVSIAKEGSQTLRIIKQ